MLPMRPEGSEAPSRLSDLISMTSELEELKHAYEGLEAGFADERAEAEYRSTMLARTAEQADFLADRLDDATVLEVGCGNGQLLIELADRGILSSGLGVDIARSRVEFARQWATELRLRSLRFEVADALELALEERSYDAIVCITGAFGYFEALRAGSASALAQRWLDSLRPHGLLTLELYPHPELVPVLAAAGGSVRLWRELEAADPWRFYLSDLRMQDGILVHDKTFIHRSSGEVDAGRRERLRLYSEDEVRALLEAAGFSEVSCHEAWTAAPYSRGGSMVVTARRAAGSTGPGQLPEPEGDS